MKIYEQTIIVKPDDLDELNHVNNVRYIEWVNDVAKSHWTKLATQDMLQNYFWVLINHHITYKSQAVLNDNILLKTSVKSSEGVTSTRIVEIYNYDTQKLLATSETKWCFMDAKTKKPARITSEIINLFL
ncbi:MAG: acyl-CoA thioesterase [Flavobacteriaceae bacterium]|nr:acyl-CoA thioesterase [Flavobacteriaceae bacterium]